MPTSAPVTAARWLCQSLCPEATWQLRIAGYRVLYSLDSGVVRILRIKWKDRLTTEEMGQ
jgi:hypothetical protein